MLVALIDRQTTGTVTTVTVGRGALEALWQFHAEKWKRSLLLAIGETGLLKKSPYSHDTLSWLGTTP